jgi:hypothetical protein
MSDFVPIEPPVTPPETRESDWALWSCIFVVVGIAVLGLAVVCLVPSASRLPALKVYAASVILFSVAFRAVMDFFWKDKRTNRYRYARNGFIITALLAAVLNGIAIGVDEVQKGRKSDWDEKRRADTEDRTLGALTPDISLQLNSTPSYPENPLIQFGPVSTNDPQDTIAVIIANSNTVPIYDLFVSVYHDLAHPDVESKVMREFNKRESSSYPILPIRQSRMIVLPQEAGLTWTAFDFWVNTKRGSTIHRIALALVSNRWECSRSVVDVTRGTNRVLLIDVSKNYPRDTNGNPVIRVERVSRVTEKAP